MTTPQSRDAVGRTRRCRPRAAPRPGPIDIDAVEWRPWLERGGNVLFIEYDVTAQGEIEVVGLINAVEEHGEDADGADWMAWRVSEFEDDGLGCVGVPAAQLALMEGTDDPDALRAIVERIILDDRAAKEQVQP